MAQGDRAALLRSILAERNLGSRSAMRWCRRRRAGQSGGKALRASTRRYRPGRESKKSAMSCTASSSACSPRSPISLRDRFRLISKRLPGSHSSPSCAYPHCSSGWWPQEATAGSSLEKRPGLWKHSSSGWKCGISIGAGSLRLRLLILFFTIFLPELDTFFCLPSVPSLPALSPGDVLVKLDSLEIRLFLDPSRHVSEDSHVLESLALLSHD